MAEEISVTVRHGEHSYRTAVAPGDRADKILLRSLDRFGIDPGQKTDFRLRFREQESAEDGVYLDRAVNEQMSDGAELVLEHRDADTREAASGNY